MMALLEVARLILMGIFEALTPGLPLASGQTPLWAAASIMAAATVMWLLSGFANDMLSARLHSRSVNIGIRSWALCPGCAEGCYIHLAEAKGRYEAAYKRLLMINRWTPEEADRYIVQAEGVRQRRSRIEWIQDFSSLERIGGSHHRAKPRKPKKG